MALIDASAASTMQLASELLEARDTIRHQRRQIYALAAALRTQQLASTTLADALDVLLAGPGDDE